MCTLSKHAFTEFTVILFAQHTLAFITSLFLDRMFAQSRNFYENNMILRFVLSDPAKSSLESDAWIDGYDYQNKDTQKTLPLWKNKSVIFFSAVYNKNPCDSTIYILLFLPSWTTSWIFYITIVDTIVNSSTFWIKQCSILIICII